MIVKKVYIELHTLLLNNKKKTVSDLMPEILKLMNSKTSDLNHKVDDSGNVTHMFCYYHKQWEDIIAYPYGSKSNSTTGLNTMCKIGVNKWTKQQRVYKQSKAELLDQLASGDLEVSELASKLEEIERAKDHIEELPDCNVQPA